MSYFELKNIVKTFDGVAAVDDVSVGFERGEIHALMGANGAGKSTLMNILAGVLTPDSGELTIDGKRVRPRSVGDAEKLGIVMIHQELCLMGDLTAAQNVFIGREPRKGPFIDDSAMKAETKKIFDRLHLDVSPGELVEKLSVGKRQMVEIAKALSKNSRLLILDEPTAALSAAETEELFEIMRSLKEKGICMIYISHRMDEIFRISDRITVMRDGMVVGTAPSSELSPSLLVQMMVGRSVGEEKRAAPADKANAETVLEVRGLSSGTAVRDVGFSLKKGEVLGFYGLVGAGRTETARAVVGIDRKDSGQILIGGKSGKPERVKIHSPADAVRHGLCYLSEDRRRDGMLLGRSVTDNTVVSALGDFVRRGMILDGDSKNASAAVNRKTEVKYSSEAQPIETLSGGNQQKVIFSRWLLADADILILDEPTRGIDVGAKDDIYKIILALVDEGKSVIIISSEAAELRRVCGRILVMCEGRITAELSPEAADDETLLKYASSV